MQQPVSATSWFFSKQQNIKTLRSDRAATALASISQRPIGMILLLQISAYLLQGQAPAPSSGPDLH